MCGNGARCVAHWAADRTGADRLSVRYASGVYDAVVDGDRVTVEMGVPSVTPADVPLARDEPMIDEDYRGFAFTAVNVGVPHVVSFVGDVADIDVEGVSPRIRHGDRFPEGTNVTFASVDPDGGFRQRTYERGVEGETDSCGTGAVAIAKAAIETGRFSSDSVVVSPPGGDLEVGIPADGAATLAGPVEREYNGTLPVPETTNTQPTA